MTRTPSIRTGTILLFLLLALALAGCTAGERSGGDVPSPAGQAGEYRSRAEGLESSGDSERALTAYREAARRYPTESWSWSGIGRTAKRLGRFGEATDGFREAVRWDSTLVDERTEIAALLLAEGDVENALEWIDERVKLGGEAPVALALRARALAGAGRIPEARKEVDRALVLDPDNVEVRIASVFVHLAADSTTQALAAIDGLSLDRPADPTVFEARALVQAALGNHEAAIGDLARAIELDPNRPRARLALAREYVRDDRLPEAIEQFRRVLERNPRDPDALEGLGTCSLALGDPEEAEAAFREAIASDPEFAPAYLALGRFVATQGSLEEAITLLRKARARASLDPALWEECSAALADAYFELDEPEHALDIAETMLSRNADSDRGRALRGRALAAGGGGPTSGDALERLASRPDATAEEIQAYGEWLLAHDEPERALSVLERRLHERPDDFVLRWSRARALASLGRSDEAETELHALLEGPETARTHLELARFYLDSQRYADALFHAREGKRLAPGDPESYALIGEASLALGDLHRARIALERERDLRPRDVDVWINLGRLEMESGYPDSAAALLRHAHELDPDRWRAAYLLGIAETGAGRPEEAIRAYRSVLARNERIAEAHNNLAWLLADLDLDPVLAEVHARRAAELHPDDPHILGTLGWAQYKNHRYEDAAETLRDATRLLPEDAMKHFMLGVVEFDRGDQQAARTEIRRALDLDPDFERAARAGELLESLDG